MSIHWANISYELLQIVPPVMLQIHNQLPSTEGVLHPLSERSVDSLITLFDVFEHLTRE